MWRGAAGNGSAAIFQLYKRTLTGLCIDETSLKKNLTYQYGSNLCGKRLKMDHLPWTDLQKLKAEGFFAQPDHSWKKGLNGNANGLVK